MFFFENPPPKKATTPPPNNLTHTPRHYWLQSRIRCMDCTATAPPIPPPPCTSSNEKIWKRVDHPASSILDSFSCKPPPSLRRPRKAIYKTGPKRDEMPMGMMAADRSVNSVSKTQTPEKYKAPPTVLELVPQYGALPPPATVK